MNNTWQDAFDEMLLEKECGISFPAWFDREKPEKTIDTTN